jgi:hypothetical protein
MLRAQHRRENKHWAGAAAFQALVALGSAPAVDVLSSANPARHSRCPRGSRSKVPRLSYGLLWNNDSRPITAFPKECATGVLRTMAQSRLRAGSEYVMRPTFLNAWLRVRLEAAGPMLSGEACNP